MSEESLFSEHVSGLYIHPQTGNADCGLVTQLQPGGQRPSLQSPREGLQSLRVCPGVWPPFTTTIRHAVAGLGIVGCRRKGARCQEVQSRHREREQKRPGRRDGPPCQGSRAGPRERPRTHDDVGPILTKRISTTPLTSSSTALPQPQGAVSCASLTHLPTTPPASHQRPATSPCAILPVRQSDP